MGIVCKNNWYSQEIWLRYLGEITYPFMHAYSHPSSCLCIH